MAIKLDKILADIAKEKALHPNNGGASKQEQDEAWARIGRLNKLSVHESRSIFIVLQKKYEQEKVKGNSSWKLFNLMHEIHQEHKVEPKLESEQLPMEEVEEFEMLEVQDQEEDEENAAMPFMQPANSTGSASSDGESPGKSHSSGSPDKEDKSSYTKTNVDTPRPVFEEKKLLNTMAQSNTRASPHTSVSVAAAALQKKGITVKKTPSAAIGSRSTPASNQLSNSKTRTTIQLPDSLKRKLSEDYGTPTQKKLIKSSKHTAASGTASVADSAPTPVVHTTTAQLMQVKKERESTQSPPPGINIITIPAATTVPMVNGNIGAATSSTAATVASTSTNGFSPHNDELDFKNDIIFDAGNGHVKVSNATTAPEIINLGNFDHSHSSRHEALGLYVANVMNRISRRAAAKLEMGILRAILDVQSDELEQ
ncbi:probable serine/threonine-protein kinase nek3 [Scaptodrosophila lebanonensis]|uniref:Probable serine/threonine-protein kinase nek3 n=1 Tax=Drosophila lebanonensis TaxID=7225 RepID=A0A6J2UII8_DROLE|nr:probable serine/threonine-protein kinase nek3 [Scaptodrosophila lebanonensis]